MTKLYVVGNPVEHSKSPQIHNYWLKKYNKNFSYEKLELSLERDVFTKQKLNLIKKVKEGEIKGINITVPFKKSFTDVLDKIDISASLAGAINTIYRDGNKTVGGNTDGLGFCNSLIEDFNFSIPKNIQILGAGGATYGILSEIIKYKPEVIYICNRTVSKAQKLVDHFKLSNISPNTIWEVHDLSFYPPSNIQLFINASYIGMKPEHKLDDYFRRISHDCFVYDINYNLKKTIFNEMGINKGINFPKNVNGQYMLIRQASESFKKWFNIKLNKHDIDEAVNLLKV